MIFFFRRICFCLAVMLTVVAFTVAPALAQASDNVSPSIKGTKPKPPPKDEMALFDAADRGDVARVRALLDKGVSASVQAPNGLTPLIMASMMNHPSVVKLLLDRGADVNASLSFDGYDGGETALIRAASGVGNIMAGAKMPSPPDGYDLHETAFEQKHPDEVHRWQVRVEVWAKGYDQIVRMLLDHGADVNAHTTIGRTAIVSAATNGDLAEVKLLIDRGARLDLPTHQKDLLNGHSIDGTNGYEALAGATSMYQHSPEVIKLLLAHGAKPNAKSTNDLTPLGRASEDGDAQVVQMLLNGGADVNAYDGFGRTAIMLARSSRHRDVITLLQKAGAKDLPEGPHTDVTLKKLGREPNGDVRMRVTITPRPGDKPVPTTQKGY